MAAILCFGASSVYGVGGSRGGWPDLLKAALHLEQYCNGNAAEVHEVYNLGVPADTSAEVLSRLDLEIQARRRPMQPSTLVLLSIGMNDSRAIETPENYVSTPDAFGSRISELLRRVSQSSAASAVVGFSPVNERLTTPKLQPRTGRRSYFTNSRIEKFESVLCERALSAGMSAIPVFRAATEVGWDAKLCADGLHPNDEGHQFIADLVLPWVRRAVEKM